MELIWKVLNSWLIAIVDLVLAFWPSTPTQFKLSTVINSAMALAPGAPWYYAAKSLTYLVWVLGVIAVVKAFKLIWP